MNNHAAAIFEQERGRLFGIAYRMLASIGEAEDIVQDAYIRWHSVAHETVANPRAYLTRLTTRLCIDALKAARNRRTEYIGPWLPEPLISTFNGATDSDPAASHELAEDLSTAFLLMLERLTPVERAVFLLHESFAFSYDEIAGIVDRSEEHCRQIARRARKHLDVAPRPKPADPQQHDQLLARFLAATRDGDINNMVALLARDAVLYSDGGGKVQAARKPVQGAEAIARFLLGLTRQIGDNWYAQPATVNGRTGLLIYVNNELQNVMTMHVTDDRIQNIFIVVNPDKLPPPPTTQPRG